MVELDDCELVDTGLVGFFSPSFCGWVDADFFSPSFCGCAATGFFSSFLSECEEEKNFFSNSSLVLPSFCPYVIKKV